MSVLHGLPMSHQCAWKGYLKNKDTRYWTDYDYEQHELSRYIISADKTTRYKNALSELIL